MADTTASFPIAVPPDESDPATLYASFSGAFDAELSETGLRFWTTDDATLRQVYSILRGAMRFVDTGETLVGSELATSPSLVVKTWPTTFLELRNGLVTPPISVISYEGLETADIEAALSARITDSLGTVDPADLATMVSTFMAGTGALVLVNTGALIGGAETAGDGPTGLTRGTTVRFWGADDTTLDPDAALTQLQSLIVYDTTGHPLLAAVSLGQTLTLTCFDESGTPLASTAYTLYVPGGTNRTGTTDANGVLRETGVDGPWFLDLPDASNFYVEEA